MCSFLFTLVWTVAYLDRTCIHTPRVLWGCVGGWLLYAEWVCAMWVELMCVVCCMWGLEELCEWRCLRDWSVCVCVKVVDSECITNECNQQRCLIEFSVLMKIFYIRTVQ